MSFLGAMSAAMPLIRWGGGYLLDKAKPYVQKGLNWLIPRMGGDINSGIGRGVKDWFQDRLNNNFGGLMDWADSYVAKKKMPIMARDNAGISTAIQDRLRGPRDTGQPNMDMDGIERIQQ